MTKLSTSKMTNPTFPITPQLLNKCTQFARSLVGGNLDAYTRRNQSNPAKIEKDIRNGKLGEEFAYQYLSSKLSHLTQPDYNIYDKSNKSWDADLKSDYIKIAVKSQNIDQSSIYGKSWIFQNREGQNYDVDKAIFQCQDENYYVVFVSLNTNQSKQNGMIEAIVKVKWLLDNNLFREPVEQHLKTNKKAVYLEDLERIGNFWQL